MTYQDADAKYKFVRNEHGSIVDYLSKGLPADVNPRCIWTDYWEDGVVSGARWVNRVAYYCTEIPVEHDVTIYITNF